MSRKEETPEEVPSLPTEQPIPLTVPTGNYTTATVATTGPDRAATGPATGPTLRYAQAHQPLAAKAAKARAIQTRASLRRRRHQRRGSACASDGVHHANVHVSSVLGTIPVTVRGVLFLVGTSRAGSLSLGRHHRRAIPSGATRAGPVAAAASDARHLGARSQRGHSGAPCSGGLTSRRRSSAEL